MSAYAHITTPNNYELAGVGISGDSGKTAFYKASYPVSNETSENKVVSNETRKNGGKRQGDSFDTGLDGVNNSRFLLIKEDIISGKCSPSTSQIKKRYKARYEYARDVLAELAKQGLLIRNEQTGQYRLTAV